MNDVIELPLETAANDGQANDGNATTTSTIANSSTNIAAKKHIGEQLMQARICQQLSIEQVAGQLKWSARQIAEIEAGNYTVLPEHSSLRGFVRTYAKILKLDPTPLLAELALETAKPALNLIDRPKLDMPFSKKRMPWLSRENNQSQRILGGLFLVCLCLTAVFVYRADIYTVLKSVVPGNSNFIKNDAVVVGAEEKAPKPIVASSAFPVTHVSAPEEGASENRRIVSSAPTAAQAMPIIVPEGRPASPNISTEVNSAISQVATTSPKNETKATELTTETPGNATSKEIDPNSALVLNFKKDTWVRIKRANGSVVVSHLYKAGDRQAVDAAEPLSLVIGNVAGVEVQLRGKPLILQPQNGSNVISLNVK